VSPSSTPKARQAMCKALVAEFVATACLASTFLATAFSKAGFKTDDFPETMNYYCKAISLPMFPTLTAKQQEFVIATLRSILT